MLKVGPAKAAEACATLAKLSGAATVLVEQAGRWFEGYSRRLHDQHSASQGLSESEAAKVVEAESDEDEDSPYTTIETGDWKKQDHYGLLGLAHLRHQSTDDDIKRAYKKMVLKYHPDKKSSGDITDEDRAKLDGHFNCIKKAYELLSCPDKRRLYDSVDDVDDTVPPPVRKPDDFYKVFAPVFARNAKWFQTQPAPLLGDDSTASADVQALYNFWYSSPTWREFGYFDEDDPNSAESREEKRWIEKNNKASRRRKKVEEHARLLRLIDNAYSCDPRIKRMKEQEKQMKLEKKRQKEEDAKREEKRKQDLAAAEEAERQRVAALAAEEEKQKNEISKKVRKNFVKACRRGGVCEDTEGPSSPELPPCTRESVDMLKATLPLPRLEELTALPPAELLAAVLAELDIARGGKKEPETAGRPWSKQEQKLLEDALRTLPKDAVDRWDQIAFKVGRTRKECVARVKECAAIVKPKDAAADAAPAPPKIPDEWTKEELQVLVKAASKVYPPGTQGDRWQLIADYIKIHAHTEWVRPAKEVVAQVAAMKNVSSTLQQRSGQPSGSLKKSKDRTVANESVPSQRF